MVSSLLGAGIGLAGSLLGGSSQPTTKQHLFDTGNLWGNIDFNKRDGTLTQNLSPFSSNMANLFQGLAQSAYQNPMYNMGQDLSLYGARGVMPAYNQANAYNLTPAGYLQPYAQQMAQMGQNYLGRNYNNIFDQRLATMREQAAPFEERAQNSLTQKLFSMGQLGPNSTAGNRQVESFGRGLAQADTGRVLDAMGFAEQLYGRDQQLGANLYGQGVQNLLNYGTQWDATGYNRAVDRLSRTTDLFGFGNQMQMLPAQQAGAYMNLLTGITGEQNNLARLGAVASSPYQAGGSPTGAAVGSFLGGLGGGMLTGDIKWG